VTVIVFITLLYTLAGLPFVFAMTRRASPHVFINAIGISILFAMLASLNFELDIIEQKFASEFAYDLFVGRDSLRSSEGFVLQYLICWPAFALTDVWWAAIGVNIAAMTLLYAYIASFNQRLGLFILAPAIVNFSMFSLRDPLIGVLFFMLAVTITNPDPIKRMLKQTGTSALFMLIRPENILIVVGAHIFGLFRRYRKSGWVLLAIPVMLVGGYVGILMIPQLLGIKFSGSILDLPLVLSEFYDRRANRWDASDGGGSNILGGRLSDIPFLFRYPIQILSFFMLPLPIDLNRPALALAALDSCVFFYLARKFHKGADARVIILFWCYVLMVSLFMSNYGNAFRLRMPAYMIMFGGLLRK
jgi:hypothetical protein